MASQESFGSPDGEHFPSFEERVRATSRFLSRNGRPSSPAHSAHGNLFRSSLVRITAEKKAKKVRFYRNGDRFFKGIVYAVSPERFRTFESLLAELTDSPMCDKTVLPKGVRYVFSLDGSRKVSNLDQLEEGESYVCASTQLFHKIDYPKSGAPNWNPNVKKAGLRDSCNSPGPTSYHQEDCNDDKDFIKPKLITVVANGSKPRKAVRLLLNKKTAHSYDQVLNDITDAIKLDTGAVKRIFTIGGKPVQCLQDFFRDENVFVVYGNERYALDDFDMDNNEIGFVSAYRSVRQKERITLRSPKAPRRMLLASPSKNPQENGFDFMRRSGRQSPRTPGSPKTSRKVMTTPSRAKSPGPTRPSKLTNGHTSNGNKSPGGSSTLLPAQLTHNYKIGKMIGQGNFATVKECIHKIKKNQYALKIINKSRCHGREQMIENEVSILRHIRHPNIIQLVEDFDTVDVLYLVMELVTGGDLFDAISSANKYTERDASGMLYNLLCAVKYLHSLSIVHRDIKPENLLVCEYPDGSKALKLGDFGLATTVKGPLYTVCGTPTYVAPEILAETGYGLPIDIWSAGVITYILMCGFPPFASPSNNQEELFDKILSGELVFVSPFWDGISDSGKGLISTMLAKDPKDRFTADEALNHPWVSDDEAKDEDIHTKVSTKLVKLQKAKKFSQTAGVSVIASTALDKGSRYFQGRKPVEGLESHQKGDDEVF